MNVMRATRKFAAAGLIAGCLMTVSLSLTGCLTDDKKDPAAGTRAWGADSTLLVGAQGNVTVGSAIDLDNRKVMLSEAAKAAQGSIDLVFIYADGELQLASPVFAKSVPNLPLAAAYDLSKIKDTQMARISTRPDTFDIVASTFATTAHTNDAYIGGGGDVLVKTDEGRYAFISVGAIQGEGATATASITVSLIGP